MAHFPLEILAAGFTVADIPCIHCGTPNFPTVGEGSGFSCKICGTVVTADEWVIWVQVWAMENGFR